jgi:hypothetical protein
MMSVATDNATQMTRLRFDRDTPNHCTNAVMQNAETNQIAALGVSFCINLPRHRMRMVLLNFADNPARPGSIVTVWASGAGTSIASRGRLQAGPLSQEVCTREMCLEWVPASRRSCFPLPPISDLDPANYVFSLRVRDASQRRFNKLPGATPVGNCQDSEVADGPSRYTTQRPCLLPPQL